MDGSLAPVRTLGQLAREHNALLLVDEAHAMGILGPEGKGLCGAEEVVPHALVGTFSKALGSHGGFVVADKLLSDWLTNRARSLIYTTALPPSVLSASLAAMAIVRTAAGQNLRARVLGLANSLRHRLRAAGHAPTGQGTPIVSLAFTQDQAVEVSRRLRDAGYLVWAFRPPTVPAGLSRLRISLNASHSQHQVDGLAESLLRVMERCPPLRPTNSP